MKFLGIQNISRWMPDYDDKTNLSKLACIVNLCKNLGDMLEILSV